MKDNTIYLKHIADAILAIENYLQGANFDAFSSSSMMVHAVIHQLEVIGEAASKIDVNFRIKNQAVPWNEMIGMRNRLIHEYFGVDVKLIWETCQSDLPALKKQIAGLVKSK
ncbi:MAG TPA: DUF86 domain-containing protein, partial [Patescibacteria group bacterium]|nr:DUF86 domain-containing protein [Patescibacteria group bacterium]